jgi:hypothetical protein
MYAGFAAQAGDVIARVPRKYTVELPNVCDRQPIHNLSYTVFDTQHVVRQSAEAQPPQSMHVHTAAFGMMDMVHVSTFM